MDARRIWVATGTLGVLGVGFGATMAVAEDDVGQDPAAVVERAADGTTTARATSATPSPSDLDPSSATTSVTAGSPTSADSANTAPSPVTPVSPDSAQTSPSAATP